MKQIDHLIYTTPDLQSGMKSIEEKLGVKPAIGGQHPQWATHNALVSLGESTYLEIMAPDPSLATPAQGRLMEKQFKMGNRLSTWVLRNEDIEDTHDKAVKNGIGLGEVQPGKREKPDGTVLSWKLTDPLALPLEGAVPFLISWGDTPHPAKSSPAAGTLVGFELSHPQPELLQRQLETLGFFTEVVKSEHFRIKAQIKTLEGIVKLF